jgi:hypothetical protein
MLRRGLPPPEDYATMLAGEQKGQAAEVVGEG